MTFAVKDYETGKLTPILVSKRIIMTAQVKGKSFNVYEDGSMEERK